MHEAGVGLAQRCGDGSGPALGAVEVEPGEDCLVEGLARGLGDGLVEVAGTVEQVKRGDEDGEAVFEIVGGLVELARNPGLILADGLEPLLDLVLGPAGIADQVEVAVFLSV